MNVISIDVGIKNCSFCILTKQEKMVQIAHWDIVNLIDASSSYALDQDKKALAKESNDAILVQNQCSHINANKKCCTKTAVYKRVLEKNKENNENDDDKETFDYFCTAHAKKDRYFVATDLRPASLKKQSLKGLQSLIKKYEIVLPVEGAKKKAELMDLLGKHHFNHGLFLINVPEKKVACAVAPLQTIGLNIISFFDAVEGIRDVTHVIIENQIGPLATKMKTVQGMLMQYFIMRNVNVCVEFISASNKLKDFNIKPVDSNAANLTEAVAKKAKQDYKGRKKQAVAICTNFLTNEASLSCWKDFFNSCKKKDDLSDCFLQGIWYLQKHQ
jgi:hypothetical protein